MKKRNKGNKRKNKEVLPVNRKAKDRLFTKVYESEENRRKLAEFLLGQEVENAEISNVVPVIFGNKENDLAFICNHSLYVMMEEQSYFCANIAYRILEYIVAALRATVDSEKTLYGSTLVRFPIPKLYVANVGLVKEGEEPEKVQYDMELSDSYMESGLGIEIEPDLELRVHVYDFRMGYAETLGYIEGGCIPERFSGFEGELLEYALSANCLTYMQQCSHEDGRSPVKPENVDTVADVIELLRERGVLRELFSKKEVCDMTMAQFSRDDILVYRSREEGRKDGELKKARETAEKLSSMGMEEELIAQAVGVELELVKQWLA